MFFAEMHMTQMEIQHSTDAPARKRLTLPRPVVLVGLMGAGKSTVGRRLAKVLGLEFHDSDQEIVEAAGCSIADIFEFYGEASFRDIERKIITNLLGKEPLIMATGGGAFMQPELRQMIQEHAISVWLRAEIDVLVDRVSRKSTRPLLEKGDKRVIMEKLMAERYPVYEQAHIVVDSGNGPHELVVEGIVDKLEAYLHRA